MLGLQNQHSVQLTHFVDVDVDVLMMVCMLISCDGNGKCVDPSCKYVVGQ